MMECTQEDNYCIKKKYHCFIEPSSIKDAGKDENWVKAMNEELDQIEKKQTWELVPRPKNKNVIGTKWVY
jgi:hypothetical protein